MIYPFGATTGIDLRTALPTDCVDVVANRDRTLIAVITAECLLVVQVQSQLVLAAIARSADDVQSKGGNMSVMWKHDTTAISIITEKSHLLIYAVTIDAESTSARYQLFDAQPHDAGLKRSTAELFRQDSRPRIELELKVLVRLGAQATCQLQLLDDIVLCLLDGWIHRLSWLGAVDESLAVHIGNVPFTHTHDMQQTRAEYLSHANAQHSEATTPHIVSAAYSPLIGGISVVLNNGRAALLISNNTQFAPNTLVALWAQHIGDACITSVNHRHRLITYGCRNSDVAVYHVDETNGTLMPVYRITLTSADIPDAAKSLGRVTCLQWYPYGHCIVIGWARKGCAIYSTYGAQLWSSMECEAKIRSFDWGAEGHQLWLINGGQLQMMTMMRAATVNNPSMSSSSDVCLHTADTVFISPSRQMETHARAPHHVWLNIQVPHAYMAHAWPLRFCALDTKRTRLVVAGTRGFAAYHLPTQKWSLFGNESQERDMLCTGGVSLWRDRHAIVSCYDVHEQCDQIRVYPLDMHINNANCVTLNVDIQTLMMCVRGDSICVLDVQSRIRIFTISSSMNIEKCAEIRCNDLVPHAACVIDLLLTNMHLQGSRMDAGRAFTPTADSLLINVEGRVMLLTPAHSQTELNSTAHDTVLMEDATPQYELQAPLVVASCVEQMWHRVGDGDMNNNEGEEEDDGVTVSARNTKRAAPQPHLVQALWLAMGCRGNRVWMPLFPDMPSSSTTFISKRIMLPFELPVYPLLMCAGECMAIGLDTEPSTPTNFARDLRRPQRRTQLFLHHILRQLLKRNLGLYALQIAATCRHLPYFAHVLELLLHQVLEEEATSSEPIPDPLLPRIVAFIQEFPEYLRTVAHCARKTELALWQQLFNCAGSPKDLFEVCLRDGDMQTAATYLIVLQNMEPAEYSKQQATRLLSAVLSAGCWEIGRDICRFLRSIAPSDLVQSPTASTPALKQQALMHKPARRPPGADNDSAFVYPPHLPNLSRHRASTISMPNQSASAQPPSLTPPQQQSPNSVTGGVSPTSSNQGEVARGMHYYATPTTTNHERIQRTTSGGVARSDDEDLAISDAVQTHIMLILTQHARFLLREYRLRDLGTFAAHLDLHLVLFLRRERHGGGSAMIDRPVDALTRLHADFKWPYPLLSHSVVESLTRRLTSSTSLCQFNGSSACSSDGDTVIPRPTALTVTRPGVESVTDSAYSTNTNSQQSVDKTVQLLLKQQRNEAREKKENGGGGSEEPIEDGEEEDQLTDVTLTEHKLYGRSDTELSLKEMAAAGGSAADWMYAGGAASNTNDAERRTSSSSSVTSSTAAQMTDTAAGVQLRYLQQIMCEAQCIEWSLLLCILLRDMVGLSRALRSANSSTERLTRLMGICDQLTEWANGKCTGYTGLLHTIRTHLAGLRQVTGKTANSTAVMASPKLSRRLAMPGRAQQSTADGTRRTKPSTLTVTTTDFTPHFDAERGATVTQKLPKEDDACIVM